MPFARLNTRSLMLSQFLPRAASLVFRNKWRREERERQKEEKAVIEDRGVESPIPNWAAGWWARPWPRFVKTQGELHNIQGSAESLLACDIPF